MKRNCLALRVILMRKFQEQLSHNWVCQFRASFRHLTITFMMKNLMSTMGAASPDTITSPGSKWMITAAVVDQEAAISMMGRLGTFAASNPPQCTPILPAPGIVGRGRNLQWATMNSCKRNLSWKGPSSALRSLHPLQASSGVTLFVDDVSSELGVRDLASRFPFRNVHRKGAKSAPNRRKTTCLRWEGPWTRHLRFCPLDRTFADFVPWHFRVHRPAHGPSAVSGHPFPIETCLRCHCEKRNQRAIREDNQHKQDTCTGRRKACV